MSSVIWALQKTGFSNLTFLGIVYTDREKKIRFCLIVMETTPMSNLVLTIEILILAIQAIIAWALFSFSRRQFSVQMKTQRLLNIHNWGNECINLLAEADLYCLLVPEKGHELDYMNQRNKFLQSLSAQIDRGRMFFENKEKEKYGLEKHPAYRGFRPKILDPLIAVYLAINSIEKLGEFPETHTRERIIEWRRYFVSLLQKEIHPDWLKQAVNYRDEMGGGAGYSINENSRAPYDL